MKSRGKEVLRRSKLGRRPWVVVNFGDNDCRPNSIALALATNLKITQNDLVKQSFT